MYAWTPPLRRFLQVALAGCAAGMTASTAARADNPSVDVVITDKGCEPIELTVAAGKTVFMIKNASKRAIEWEILKDNMVVEERENIVPGFVQKLTATLEAGAYGMTCGLLSNPKGNLTVTAKTGAIEPLSGRPVRVGRDALTKDPEG